MQIGLLSRNKII